MAKYIGNRLILEGRKADWFMENALNPDREALRLRDAYFTEIAKLNITEKDGVYTSEIPDGDIILSGNEADWFMEQFLKPDPEVMRRRNAYFAKIDEMNITEEDGVVSFEIPYIDLEETKNE